MFTRFRAFWKRRRDKRVQEAIDRTTYEAEERHAAHLHRGAAGGAGLAAGAAGFGFGDADGGDFGGGDGGGGE